LWVGVGTFPVNPWGERQPAPESGPSARPTADEGLLERTFAFMHLHKGQRFGLEINSGVIRHPATSGINLSSYRAGDDLFNRSENSAIDRCPFLVPAKSAKLSLNASPARLKHGGKNALAP
jgi:hypothetical protein